MIEQPRQMVFLVGVGRSGTSLLQAMLNAHSQIAFLPETGFVRHYVLTRKLSGLLRQHGVSTLEESLASDARIGRLGSDLASRLQQQGLLNKSANIENADKLIYNFLHESLQSAITGDKDPKLVEHIGVLKLIWPACKIIHIYRDPRDVLLSKKHAKWSQSQSDFARLVANVAQFGMAAAAENRFGRDQILRVRYESLIENPETALQAICDWLGTPFESVMLTHQKSAEKLVFNDEMQWKSEVLGPLITDNAGKWQAGLTAFEAQWAARCCAQAMLAGGYEQNNGSGAVVAAKVSLFTLPVLIAARLYRFYRSACNRKLLRKLGC